MGPLCILACDTIRRFATACLSSQGAVISGVFSLVADAAHAGPVPPVILALAIILAGAKLGGE